MKMIEDSHQKWWFKLDISNQGHLTFPVQLRHIMSLLNYGFTQTIKPKGTHDQTSEIPATFSAPSPPTASPETGSDSHASHHENLASLPSSYEPLKEPPLGSPTNGKGNKGKQRSHRPSDKPNGSAGAPGTAVGTQSAASASVEPNETDKQVIPCCDVM